MQSTRGNLQYYWITGFFLELLKYWCIWITSYRTRHHTCCMYYWRVHACVQLAAVASAWCAGCSCYDDPAMPCICKRALTACSYTQPHTCSTLQYKSSFLGGFTYLHNNFCHMYTCKPHILLLTSHLVILYIYIYISKYACIASEVN